MARKTAGTTATPARTTNGTPRCATPVAPRQRIPGLSDEARREIEAQAAWGAVSAAFGALGRAFICADTSFHIIHGSFMLDRAFGAGTAAQVEGQLLEDVLGRELFGPEGTLRQALVAQEKREGWRAHLHVGDGEPHVVSVSAAPMPRDLVGACDPRVAYVVVLRPAEQDLGDTLSAPTVMGGLIARSPAFLKVFSLVENLRHTDAAVLISGESGTGKELVARAIHERSLRRNGPFVAVNCAALPADLLESEMFGHVRGAFTGAVRDRIGRFEMASDGTLFLDEIGDMPLTIQVKLLRVLQDGTFERVGENRPRVSRARVIAATHVDLLRAVSDGRFRDDLYFRLRVVPIEIPPLRERREDIEPVARALLARVGARHGRALQFSPDALRTLLQHSWPGNVRELENVIEFAVAVCAGQTILPDHLPQLFALRPPPERAVTAPGGPPLGGRVRVDGAEALRRALDAHQWRRDETARALGLSRVTLWRRMRGAGLA
ncbi:MAG: sigma-54-dependent Fis family transcriptional regulator [Acidobacteria bacterium]|nr:sigma-54-dependent Fis family transcriptional regulator [Acidobacteriota bacterium]